MSIETIKVIIDGNNFYIQQFKFEDTVILETITASLLSPALDMLEGLKELDQDIDLANLGATLQKILFSLRKENPFDFIKKMVKNTFWEGEKGEKIQLNNDGAVNRVFHGKTIMCMRLLVEIMKANKFAFIEGLVGRGLNITDILKKASGKEIPLKGKSEK